MRLLLCTVLAAALGCACGDGGPLNRHQYRHEASRICRHGNARVERITVTSVDDPAAAARDIARVIEAHRETLRSLRELEPPKHDVVTLEKWLAVVDQLLDEADALRAALDAGDDVRARETGLRALVLAERAHVLATEYGIHPCRLRRRSLGM